MTTATSEVPTAEADRYLKEVAPHLAALPAEERAELLDDLAQHLAEIAAEPGPPLQERLGSPADYAAELLATAGVTADRTSGRTWMVRAAAAKARLDGTAVGREAARLWPSLRPTWWVARGYLAVSLLSALDRGGSYPGFPLPRLFGSSFGGLVAVVLAVAFSIRLGQRRLGRVARLALAVANVALLLFALVLAERVGRREIHYIGASPPVLQRDGCLRTSNGVAINNLYAYDAEGRLLDPVLLYDDRGRPIDNLCPEADHLGRPFANRVPA